MNLIKLLSINLIFSETTPYQPESFVSEDQALKIPDSTSKKRIAVDYLTRVQLTEYFLSHNGKVSPKEASQLFSIGFENCRKLLRKLHRGESISERPTKKKHATKLLPEHHVFIIKLIEDNPKISNQSVANLLSTLHNNPVNVSRSTIRRFRQQYLCNKESPSTEEYTEESPFDNQQCEFDSLTLDLGMMQDFDDLLFSFPSSSSIGEI